MTTILHHPLHKRKQIQHDVANQIVSLALYYGVDVVAVENLSSLAPPRNEGELSWMLSSWARNGLMEKLEYRLGLVGVELETVFAVSTSRTCPRCGGCGRTVKSPDHDEECWHGGHFKCDNITCGFEGDRDYVGFLNIARVYLSDNGLHSAESSAYMEEDNALGSRSPDASASLSGNVKE